jgi:hypothetical protein
MVPCKSDAQRAADDRSADDLLRFVVRRFESGGEPNERGRQQPGGWAEINSTYSLG